MGDNVVKFVSNPPNNTEGPRASLQAILTILRQNTMAIPRMPRHHETILQRVAVFAEGDVSGPVFHCELLVRTSMACSDPTFSGVMCMHWVSYSARQPRWTQVYKHLLADHKREFTRDAVFPDWNCPFHLEVSTGCVDRSHGGLCSPARRRPA